MVLPLVEEAAAAVRPARHLGDRTGLGAGRTIELLEPGIAIRLQQAGEGRHMGRRMRAAAIGAVEVGRRRRGAPAIRSIVAHIDPEPPGLCSAEARRRNGHCRVVAMDLLGGEDMRTNGGHDRVQQPGGLSNPIAQCRAIEFQTLPGIDVALPIERQVIAVFRDQQMGQHGGRGAATRRRHGRSRRLGDGIARTAGKFRPHVPDHLEVPGHVVQHLGHVLPELPHAAAQAGQMHAPSPAG
jgi:hypothetical protein